MLKNKALIPQALNYICTSATLPSTVTYLFYPKNPTPRLPHRVLLGHLHLVHTRPFGYAFPKVCSSLHNAFFSSAQQCASKPCERLDEPYSDQTFLVACRSYPDAVQSPLNTRVIV